MFPLLASFAAALGQFVSFATQLYTGFLATTHVHPHDHRYNVHRGA